MSRRTGIAGLPLRHRVENARVGMLNNFYLGLGYNLGFFGLQPDSRDFGGPLHGYGVEIYLDTLFPGPM